MARSSDSMAACAVSCSFSFLASRGAVASYLYLSLSAGSARRFVQLDCTCLRAHSLPALLLV
eukprot:6080700-Pleurochrysis_carterae.AAC.1